MSAIQHVKLSGGGYVLHRITDSSFKGRCSAWFDEDGNIIAAAQFVGEKDRNVKKNGPIWKHLETVGARYAGKNKK